MLRIFLSTFIVCCVFFYTFSCIPRDGGENSSAEDSVLTDSMQPETPLTKPPLLPTMTNASLVISPTSASLQFDEGDLSQEHTITIKLDNRPKEDVAVLLLDIQDAFKFNIEGEYTKRRTRRGFSYEIIFSPENWNDARTIALKWNLNNDKDQGFVYHSQFNILMGNASSSLRRRLPSYSVRVRDDDAPTVLSSLQGVTCNKGTVLRWNSACNPKGSCDTSSISTSYEIFYAVNGDAEAVTTSSPSIPLTYEQSKLTDNVLFRHLLGYQHTELANDVPISYKIRFRIEELATGNVEYSPLSDAVTLQPVATDTAVACPGNGEGTSESPYKIKRSAHIKEMASYPWASFQIQNNIRLENDFETVGKNLSLQFGFLGHLDGQGYSITNLRQPFFHRLSGSASVKNLHLDSNINIEVAKRFCIYTHRGILANENYAHISHVYMTGSVVFTVNTNALNSDTLSSCGILGGFSVGGVSGSNSGTIQNSYTTASIYLQGKTGTHPVDAIELGGIVGHNRGRVKNSFSTSTLNTDNSTLNPAGENTRYYTHIGGITGEDIKGGVTNTVFHALGILPIEKVTGAVIPDGEPATGTSYGVIGESARLNSMTVGGDWADPEIWNLGSDSEYPCLVGLPDIANHPSDGSIICSSP